MKTETTEMFTPGVCNILLSFLLQNQTRIKLILNVNLDRNDIRYYTM